MTSQPPKPPTIHEAVRGTVGSDGVVYRGPQIDEVTAVARRRAGDDVVICGAGLAENRRLARRVEGAVGPPRRDRPHLDSAGPGAMPHYQQEDRGHAGHTFYETPHRKARRR